MAERYFDGTFFKRDVTLNYFQCDVDVNAQLHFLLGTFSELAGDEGISYGQSYELYQEHGYVFLITRMSARIERLPRGNEQVVFTTWFRKNEGAFFMRDCDVRTPSGELLVSLSGTWVLLDMQTHAIADPSLYPGKPPKPFPDKHCDAPECHKIIPAGALSELGTRPVYFSDLDCNHHMNNSVYTRIACDFLPEHLRGRRVRDYVVNFNREVRISDTLELRGCETEHGYIIMGYTGETLHFGSEFTFAE